MKLACRSTKVSGQVRNLAAGCLLVSSLFSSAMARASSGLASCPRSAPRVTTTAVLSERWTTALAQVCDDLATMPDLDRWITLEVSARGEDLELTASLPDGRTTTRTVHSPDELKLTLSALATSITPPVTTPQRRESPADMDAEQPRSQRTEPGPARLNLEVGASLSGRVAGAPTRIAPSLGAYAGVAPGKWLLALTVRWEPTVVQTGASASKVEMDAAGGGFLFARRFTATPHTHIDTALTASVLMEAQSFEASDGEHAGSEAGLRLGLMSRALLGSSNPRWTFSIEGNVSPARLRRDLRIDEALPKLAAWELGAGFGASWSEL